MLDRKHAEIILHPIPSSDPNDPLNWGKWYKALQFGLVSFYTLMVFVNVDIGTVSWGPLNTDLGISFAVLTGSFGLCCAGLAVGCVVFIPFALKFGRRPIYLVSITVSLAAAVWSGRMMTAGDLLGTNAVGGLAGSIAETICQMTIADIFFVHQRGTANGVYLLMVNVGSFLAPVAAGYAADSMGWRWIWWWTAIFFGVCIFAFVFLYEETKYDPVDAGVVPPAAPEILEQLRDRKDAGDPDVKTTELGVSTTSERLVDRTMPRKPYLQRLAIFPANTDFTGGWDVLLKHTYQPFVIITTFPAITYSALMYGSILAWFSVIVNVWSIYFILPPYNFSASGIGLMNLPPFIGGIVGSLYGGLLNDWLIVKLARRNNGVFEPEMRLWVALPAVLAMPTSILLFGLATANGLHWIVPCIGSGIFGFAMVTLGDVGLTYAMDCYVEVSIAALVRGHRADPTPDHRRRPRRRVLRPESLRHHHLRDLDVLDRR